MELDMSRLIRRKRVLALLLALIAVLGFRTIFHEQYHASTQALGLRSLPCRSLPGARDVSVHLRTGSTQIEAVLPAYLDSILQCAPNYAIWSDAAETFEHNKRKYEVRDVLRSLSSDILPHPELALYRRLRVVGRKGLDPSEVTGARDHAVVDKSQKLENDGWKLDKWKFLPLMVESFNLDPHKKWYIFLETDTYIFWSTTLKYLEKLDHTQPLAFGHRSVVRSPYPFLHGGSSFIVSNEAMRRTVSYINKHNAELEKFVADEWAGDIALAYVFAQSGVELMAAWPIYKPHAIGILDFGMVYEDKRFWCYPAGSFHHMTPTFVRNMWQYEQEWIKTENRKDDPETFIRHADVFSDFLLGRLRIPRDDWDNQCKHLEPKADSIDACELACEKVSDCIQWLWDAGTQECKTLNSVRLGENAGLESNKTSGWIFDRAEKWRDGQMDEPCFDETFITDNSLPAVDLK